MDKKVIEILEKGQDMTFSEIDWLRSKGVKMDEIAKSLEVSYHTIYRWLKARKEKNEPKKQPRTRKKIPIFAVYKGDDLICIGTKEECAKEMGVQPRTVSWMTTPSVKKADEIQAKRRLFERCESGG